MKDRFFTPATFDFLKRLNANNNRDWFNRHKQEYEDAVRGPALDYIDAMVEDIEALSPHFLAVPKKVGGSLMRVYRDIRFGKDKRPFKTNIGIQFRHFQGKDVHAPGFYVHLEPDQCFFGVGIWHPDAPTLGRLRAAIQENGKGWVKASRDRKFTQEYELAGDSLANAPRGVARDHPLLTDLKRKDFIALHEFKRTLATGSGFKTATVKSFRTARPFMQYLCAALELPF